MQNKAFSKLTYIMNIQLNTMNTNISKLMKTSNLHLLTPVVATITVAAMNMSGTKKPNRPHHNDETEMTQRFHQC